jgi:hypothetical protein
MPPAVFHLFWDDSGIWDDCNLILLVPLSAIF